MDAWAAALGRIPSGLFVLTCQPSRKPVGMLASWVMQAGFRPPMVTMALAKDRPFIASLAKCSLCVVNILPTHSKDILIRFGKPEADSDPFSGLELVENLHPPVLARAHAYLMGKPVETLDSADHRIVLLEIMEGNILHQGEPVVHIRRNGMNY
jgi:flavin reductase (DIM6/NTAB) family NADH-FMN oxidoreductase RutF